MIRLFVLGRRAPGITRRAAHEYLREAHAKLVLCQPPGSGAPLAGYTQNHVVDGIYFATSGVHAVERDLLTELCFASLNDMRAGLASNYYRTVLAPDELRFVDDGGAVKMMVESQDVKIGLRGDHKLFVLLGRSEAADNEAWESATGRLTDAIAGRGDCVALATHRVLPPPVGAPFVDLILECWLGAPETASTASDVAALISSSGGAVEPRCSLLLATEGFNEDRLRVGIDRVHLRQAD